MRLQFKVLHAITKRVVIHMEAITISPKLLNITKTFIGPTPKPERTVGDASGSSSNGKELVTTSKSVV